MIQQLKQIQNRFNKASQSYDDVATVQRQAAKFLVDKLLTNQNFAPRTVLDLGTGTGYIPELLLPRFQKAYFYLNDIADDMLEVCKSKFHEAKNIYYLTGDMMKLNADTYDLVISNLAMQWASDLHCAIKFSHSKSANTFAFSTLLDGTFKEWQNVINQYQSVRIMDYPKAEELISLCNQLKRQDQTFTFWLADFSLSFNSPSEFMLYLRLLGASASRNLVCLGNIKKLVQTEQQSLTVTYKIFFGIFRKES